MFPKNMASHANSMFAHVRFSIFFFDALFHDVGGRMHLVYISGIVTYPPVVPLLLWLPEFFLQYVSNKS
jgi:hypothetical protein